MKKILVSLLLLAVAFGTFGAETTAFAQGQQPPLRTGMGIMHDYMVAALADKLDLGVDEVNERLLAGETMYMIALSEGIAEADIPEFLAEVRAQAFAAAVADGVVTQDWANRMSQRMMGRSRDGSANGTCPMGGTRPQDGSGSQYGSGMGGRGMRGWWQQDKP